MYIFKSLENDGTMLDFCMLNIKNITFYIEHREDLVNIKSSNAELIDYILILRKVVEMYEHDDVPSWFKNHNAHLFESANFPFDKPYLSWLFSFKEYCEILINGDGEIIDNDKIRPFGSKKIYTAIDWRKKKKYGTYRN